MPVVRVAAGARRSSRWASASDQALHPVHGRARSGYRLLHEYFAFPGALPVRGARSGSRKALARAPGRRDRRSSSRCRAAMPTLEPLVDQDSFALHCTPAVNLFPRRSDRIHVTDQQSEHHVVVDRTRPLDFEVYAIKRVTGYGDGRRGRARVPPVLRLGRTPTTAVAAGYFTVRREPRVAVRGGSAGDGPRTSYIGSEVFLSLVDPERGAVLERTSPAGRRRARHQPRPAAADARRGPTPTSAWQSRAPVDGDPVPARTDAGRGRRSPRAR